MCAGVDKVVRQCGCAPGTEGCELRPWSRGRVGGRGGGERGAVRCGAAQAVAHNGSRFYGISKAKDVNYNLIMNEMNIRL